LDDRPVEVWYPVEPTAVEGQSSEMFDSINAISEVLRPFIPGDLGGEVDTGTYRDAPPATEGGPFPTAAYSHGSPGYRQAATFLTGHLASHGVITIAVEHLGRSLSTLLTPLAGADTPEDDVADLLGALDLVGSDPGLGSVVDTSRMVVIGHSAGARTAALATADDRVVGVVLLAGVPQELATNRPALMVAFENDALIDPAGIWSLHRSLDNSVFVNIAGTGHAAPIDACPLIQDRGGLTELREALGEAIVRAGEDGCLPKDTDARAVQDLLRIYITGFVYEALGLSEGPVNLTAEVADLVAGVELRGFNEPPTTTAAPTTTQPPTTTAPTTTAPTTTAPTTTAPTTTTAPITTALRFVEPNPTLGTPCGEHMEPTIDGSTLGGDLVQGWGFIHKHPIGFAEHGCLVVSATDGYPTRSGEHALRFEVREGDCNSNENWDDCTTDRSRHELSQYWLPSTEGTYHPQYDGDEYWYGWSEYLPSDVLKQGDSITFLGQFNSDNAARFYIEDFADGLGFRFNDRNYEFLGQGVLKPNDVVRDTWIDIVVHVIWSTSVDGLIEIYVNGDLAETLTGPNMDGATYTSFAFGIYNAFISGCRCEAMPTQVVYYDALRRGRTFEEVSPSN
jgi:dienelactone hydrolase